MGNDGFDFRPPRRREQKRFEPPPWESDAFEELQRKRAQAEREAAEAAVEPSEPLETAPPTQPLAQPTVSEPSPELDERQVLEMLASLAEEEPAISDSTWRVAVFSALVMGAVGAVLIVWGMAALVGAEITGTMGVVAGSVVLFFGAVFVGAAWWLTVRTLRQRGVL